MKRALALLLLACATAPIPVRAEPVPARLLVLDGSGRPLAGALVLRGRGREQGLVLFEPGADVVARSDASGRVLSFPADARDGALIVWAAGHAPALVPPGPGAASVRLVVAESTAGRVRLSGGRLGAAVEIIALPLDASGDLAQRTVTDAEGRFRFPALHAGRWRLLLRRPGGDLQTLAVAEAGADLGERRVSGVTQIKGRLLDADGAHGDPAADVRLRFVHLDGPVGGETAGESAGAVPTQLEVTTDPTGAFVVDGLAEGVHRVEFVRPGLWVFEPAAPRVEAQAGRARDIPAWFAVRLQAVRGRVVDVEDRPLRGASVRLVQPAPPADAPVLARGPEPDAVLSGPDGSFTIRGATPGPGHRLMVSLAGHSPWISNPFDVHRARRTELEPARLRRGWRVDVRVRDLDGAPIVGALVQATAASRPSAIDDPLWRPMVRTGRTDADGRLALTDLPAEGAVCRVEARGWLPAETTVPYPRVGDARQVDFDLQPAATLTGQVIAARDGPTAPFRVEARPRDGRRAVSVLTDATGAFRLEDLEATGTDVSVLRPGDAPGAVRLAHVENVVPGVEAHLEIPLPALHAVRGEVRQADLAGARVSIVVETLRYEPGRERYVWHVERRVPLEAGARDLAFEVADLPPGLYAVRAVQEALDSGAVSVLVDAQDVEGVALTLPAGARLAGVVRDPEGDPVLGAPVTLERLHGEDASEVYVRGPLRRFTNERGEYVIDGLAPGLWRLVAGDPRGQSAEDREVVRLLDGEVLVARDLVLADGGVIEGRVEDAEGRALDGMQVHVHPFDEDGPTRTVRTDVDGGYRADRLPAGAYRVRLERPGRTVEAVTEVEAGAQPARVDFTAAHDGTIAGTVLSAGRPLAGATLDLMHEPADAGPLVRHRGRTGVGGTFEFTGLPAGAWRLQLQSGAWRTERLLDLPEGDRLHIDLEAYEGRLRGTVVNRAGDPVSGAFVVARPLGEDGARPDFVGEGRTDPAGAFVLRGLPVGAYDLTVSAPGLPPGRFARAEADLPGADYPVEVVMGRGGDLALTVVDAADRGVTGASVWLEDATGAALHRQAYLTGAAGRLTIEGVPAGRIVVRLHARGLGRPAPRAVDVREGQVTPVAFQLGPAGFLRLVVTGPGSDPLGRARIDVVRAGTDEVVAARRPLSPIRLAEPWGHVPRTGVVVVPDLAAGRYEARISAGRTYEPASIPFVVETGETTEIRVALVPR